MNNQKSTIFQLLITCWRRDLKLHLRVGENLKKNVMQFLLTWTKACNTKSGVKMCNNYGY